MSLHLNYPPGISQYDHDQAFGGLVENHDFPWCRDIILRSETSVEIKGVKYHALCAAESWCESLDLGVRDE